MLQRRVQPGVWDFKNCAVIVAHPAEETLWAGGTILLHPEAKWTVAALWGKADPRRSERFAEAMKALGASGVLGQLEESAEQEPLPTLKVQNAILELLPSDRFDLVITHGPWEEYTGHRRHEETAKAVFSLWEGERLFTEQIWRFAYEDGGGKYLPRFVRDADKIRRLPEDIWSRKYRIITEVYGYGPDSFEAKVTPREEAFWCFLRKKRPGLAGA